MQDYQPLPAPVAQWYDGMRISRSELRVALRLVLVLAAAGVPVGLAWLILAPRREYEVVDGGFRAIEPQSEALIGADAWLVLLTGVLGMLAAALVWRLLDVRGVSIVSALAVGMVIAAVVAWQVGELIGAGASAAEQAQLGAIVTPALQLRSIPVLIIGAFLSTLIYVVVVCFVPRDDLRPAGMPRVSSGWSERTAAAKAPEPRADPREPSAHGAAGVPGPPIVPR